MLSEDFDKKIREAAKHHHPPYDERAWAGMKKQLDKHMPVEDDRRRRGLFFLLLFLLLGGGAAFYFLKPSGNKEQPSSGSVLVNREQGSTRKPSAETKPAAENITTVNQPDPVKADPATRVPEKQVAPVNIPAPVQMKEPFTGKQSLPSSRQPGSGNAITIQTHTAGRGTRTDKQVKREPVRTAESQQDPGALNNTKNTTRKSNPVNQPAALTTTTSSTKAEKEAVPSGNITDPQPSTRATTAASKPVSNSQPVTAEEKINKEEAKEPVKTKESLAKKENATKPKSLSRPKSNFFFAVSGGPDVSFTSGDELGRMKMVGGFGIGYTFRGRITLRTGFYTARKVYTASPANYKGSALFYQYYPNLQKVDADCEVQEIPLNLSYHFGNRKSRPLFISAGVSSLIMKEETYNYFYRYNASSPVISRSHSTYNQNRHYFSQLNLSAGYQLPVGRRFSVIAEPYLKLPLGGVGNGRVRLNSTGIMFSITADPFGKSAGKPR